MIVTEERRASALGAANGTRRRSRFRGVWEWFRSAVAALFLFVVIRSFFVEAFKIPTGSMEGTLLVGDFLLVNKLVYGAEVPFTNQRLPKITSPKVGDVIVFDYPRDPS